MSKKLFEQLKIDDMIEVSVDHNRQIIQAEIRFSEEARRIICRVLTFHNKSEAISDILIEIDPSHDCQSWQYGTGYPEGYMKPSESIDNKSCWWISKEAFHRIVSSRGSISSKENVSGCKCNRCKEFIQYAEPNQADGTMICYSCRQNPWR